MHRLKSRSSFRLHVSVLKKDELTPEKIRHSTIEFCKTGFIQRIVDHISLFDSGYQACLPENCQVLRYRGLAYVQQSGEGINTQPSIS